MGNKLPNSLINRLNSDPLFDVDNFKFIKDEQYMIRFNKHKSINRNAYPIGEPVAWCDEAYHVTQNISVADDPFFYAGCYSMQHPNLLVWDYVLRELALTTRPVKVLDVCAAEGEASTLINAAVSTSSLIVANEGSERRIPALKDKLIKYGRPNFIITNNDPSVFGYISGYFDLLFVNAPSSQTHSGLFLENEELDLEHVKLHSERQKRILQASLPSLKTDGYLMYSVSAYSKEENEDIVNWLIDEFDLESVALSVDKFETIKVVKEIKNNGFAYRFHSEERKEGAFFFAVLRKRTEQLVFSAPESISADNQLYQVIKEEWLETEEVDILSYNSELCVFVKGYGLDLSALGNILNIRHIGARLGEVNTRNQLVPSHDLALSTVLRQDLPAIELSLTEVQEFLKEESNFSLDIMKEELCGWVLLRYKNIGIGWIKGER